MSELEDYDDYNKKLDLINNKIGKNITLEYIYESILRFKKLKQSFNVDNDDDNKEI